MDIAVLGTGGVGRAIAGRLTELGHRVVIGTRDVDATLARTGTDALGNPPFASWHDEHPAVSLVRLPEAGLHGPLIVNATPGTASVAALEAAGAEHFRGTVILDLANPLDFSAGFPPSLSVVNTDSLAERIQRAFPHARVVKALNTVTALVMVDPARVPGEHHVFVAGEDAAAKQMVVGLLREFGWGETSIIDLGGVQAARGPEMYLPLWITLLQTLGTADFNIQVVRRS